MSSSDSGLPASDPGDRSVRESVRRGRPDPGLPGGIPLFLLALLGLALIRIALGYLSLPVTALPAANLVIAALFLAVPVIALFFAANSNWAWQSAAGLVVGGLILQFGLIALGNAVQPPGPVAGIMVAIAQGGLACWCAGLGALLATRIKDKNILLPIAIFLAAYDFFLVLTPVGFTQTLLKVAQPVFSKVAGQIPALTSHPTHGLAQAGAYIGMADFVFLAMFFIALFRFRMRTRQTLKTVLPALILYLLIVMVFGNYEVAGLSLSQLPALVPIGLAVLIVNWREFELTKEEKVSTVGVAVFVTALLVFAATRPKPQAEPSRRADVPTLPAPAGLRD